MFLQLPLHIFIFLLLPLPHFSSLIARPGCLERCGNIPIPFPFGVGSNCSITNSGSFNIKCDSSTNPPKLLFASGLEIIEINTSYVRVNYPFLVAGACYNGGTHDSWKSINLSLTKYTLSDENWLTAIGCDDIVVGIGEANQNYGGGCVSYCAKRNDSGVGFCASDAGGYSAGAGCCRTPVPKGTTWFGAQLTDFTGKWRSKKLFRCSYAFVEEKVSSNGSGFSYPFSLLDDPTAFNNTWPAAVAPPVVRMDWRIGSENCSQARLNSTLACQSNSECVDFGYNLEGYLCHCMEGYEGNPYLSPGCLDVNECGDSEINPCGSNSICTNTVGSVSCSCPNGYYGDGRKNGIGCIRLSHSKIISVWIGLGAGLGSLLLLLICFWLYKIFQKRKDKIRKENFFKRNGGLLLEQQTHEGTLAKTKHFPAKELDKATDHFNENRILGQGGQGTVYKGMLSDGKIVAIKKSKLVDKDQLHQFINEVVILSEINHRNVVRLLGCCLETEVPLLVYEFMPNGTLFDLIHDPSSGFPLSWNTRLKIAADVAGALAYLHSASSIPIFHRDIKSSNILLDEKYVVKVSDFGTSKPFAADQTHQTTMVKGTIGYLDPEYFQSSQFTEKSDVYSFGVVLVELLTGQRPISMERLIEQKSLVTRFLACLEADNLDAILDSRVMERGRKEEIVAVSRLAQRCLNLKGKMRPTMKEVATELESLRMSQGISTVREEFGEGRVSGVKAVTISDNDYSWTGGNSVASSSDLYPLMNGMV